LFWHLNSSRCLDQLVSADWDALLSWLSQHQDDSTLSQIHQLVMDQRKLARNCSTATLTTLTEARVRSVIDPSRSSLGGAQLEATQLPLTVSTAALDIIQDTISMMKELDIPRSKGLYDIYLRTALQGHRWFRGLAVWDAATSAEERPHLPPASTAFRAQVIRCHLQLGNTSEASRLLQSMFDQTSWADVNSVAAAYNGQSLQVGGGGQGEAEAEQPLVTVESRAEYFRRRQSQAQRAIQTLQKTNIVVVTSDSTSRDTTEHQSQQAGAHSWKAEVYPPLIEAICLGEREQSGAILAVDLATELLQGGYLLDRMRFALLVQHVGAATSSERAESFMKDWVDMVKAMPLSLLSSGGNKEILDSDVGSSPASGTATSASKDLLRKHKRTAVSTAKSFVEVGLQEIVRQATSTQDYTRAFSVFQEMSDQGFPLYLDTSDKLMMGLAKTGDLQSATTVLEMGLQHKRVPSIEAVNTLLQGLIRNDWLDESVSIFRDLTENHGIRPSKESYRHLLHLTSSYGQLVMTQRLLSTLKSLGVERDGAIYRDLMRCYIRSDNLTGAIKVFENMDVAGISTTIQHINVLLEGAIRQSTPSTVIRILEIMSSQKIRPDAETWNILLGGAFKAKDKELALGLFQELAQSLVERAYVKMDATFRAARHPVTFNLLVNEYADRFGIEKALTLLDEATEARFPALVTQNVYRDLLEKSSQQNNGRAGYRVYRLLRQWEQRSNLQPISSSKQKASGSRTSSSTSATTTTTTTTRLRPLAAFSATSTSASVRAPSLSKLYCGVMEQLDKEGRFELGNEMATDLILSGVELDQELVEQAVRLYARSGELAAAFGLFMKMGRAYGVEPSKEMVLSLMDAAKAYQLIPGQGSVPASADNGDDVGAMSVSGRWDDTSVQQWTRILKVSMAHFGLQ
jgi:pentatricopeptide repeat protein